MTTTGMTRFDKTVEKTNIWLKELGEELHLDKDQAYLTLRAGLFALRNRLTTEEAIHLGDELPMLVRGIYYEGWKPGVNPAKQRNQEEFFQSIMEMLGRDDINRPPQDIAKAVFRLISEHVSPGEAKDVRGQLPKDLQRLWPN